MANRRQGGDPEDSAELRPLHGGRHGIDPELLAHNQRERLIAAIAAAVAEHGYNDTTIAQITDLAAVSKRTFYENFAGKEQCFLAAYEALDGYIADLMSEAAAPESEWPDQIAAAFAALIRFLAERPNFARLYLIESVVVGETLVPAREQTSDRFNALLAPGRKLDSLAREPAEGIEEALIGGALTLLARRIIAGEGEELDRFIPAVIDFVLSPYLGPEVAREVAERHA